MPAASSERLFVTEPVLNALKLILRGLSRTRSWLRLRSISSAVDELVDYYHKKGQRLRNNFFEIGIPYSFINLLRFIIISNFSACLESVSVCCLKHSHAWIASLVLVFRFLIGVIQERLISITYCLDLKRKELKLRFQIE
jgi:hypothetical protein